jgi:hypothetical protein
MTTTGKNRIMIYSPKTDGTFLATLGGATAAWPLAARRGSKVCGAAAILRKA